MKERAEEELSAAAQRLCSEIQLFDLCDLENCLFRKGRFCSNEELLRKFESIKDEDDIPDIVYAEDEFETEDESDFEEPDEDYESEDK